MRPVHKSSFVCCNIKILLSDTRRKKRYWKKKKPHLLRAFGKLLNGWSGIATCCLEDINLDKGRYKFWRSRDSRYSEIYFRRTSFAWKPGMLTLTFTICYPKWNFHISGWVKWKHCGWKINVRGHKIPEYADT